MKSIGTRFQIPSFQAAVSAGFYFILEELYRSLPGHPFQLVSGWFKNAWVKKANASW
jgi:hypothetical protein